MAAGSSSAADSIALAGDRVDCLCEWTKESVSTSEGPQFNDTLQSFNGDKVAQWLEGGCQLGGNYKCDPCGVKIGSNMDFAHCNQLPYRSPKDIQSHILTCIYKF